MAEEEEPQRRSALGRLFDHYLRTVDAAARRLYPDILRLPAGRPGSRPRRRSCSPSARRPWRGWTRSAPNLVAAVRHAAEHGPRPVAWLLADALRGYFWARMHTVDWLAVAQAALAAADGQPQAQAAARLSLGDLRMRQGRYADGRRPLPAGVRAEPARTGWLLGEVAARCNLGVVYWQLGQLRRAASQFTGRTRWAGGPAGSRGRRPRLATSASSSGRWAGSTRRPTSTPGRWCWTGASSPAWARRSSWRTWARPTTRWAGWTRPLEQLTRALALHRDVGDRDTEADTLHRLAAVHRDAGRHAEALELARAAVELARETGNHRAESDATNTLATVHHHLGHHADAVRLHERALGLARDSGSRYPEAHALIGLAAAHHCAGRVDPRPRRRAPGALAGPPAGVPDAGGPGAHPARRHPARPGRRRAGGRARREALKIHEQCGHRLGCALAHLVLGRALAVYGRGG